MGDGNTTTFWHDYWTDLGPLILAIGNRGPRDLRINLEAPVSSVVVNSEWFLPPARFEEAMTLQIVLSTMVPPQPNRGPDVYLWHNGADHFVPKFSSKAIWHRIRETSPEVPWFDLVWFKEEIPRCSFVCWMAIQSRLPTKDKLSSWGHQCSNALCPLLYGSGVSPAPLLLLSL